MGHAPDLAPVSFDAAVSSGGCVSKRSHKVFVIFRVSPIVNVKSDLQVGISETVDKENEARKKPMTEVYERNEEAYV